jgi:hypothetical protein
VEERERRWKTLVMAVWNWKIHASGVQRKFFLQIIGKC